MQFSSSLRFRFSKASNAPKNINELQYWSEEAHKKTAYFTSLLETTKETNEVFIHQNILSYNKPSAHVGFSSDQTFPGGPCHLPLQAPQYRSITVCQCTILTQKTNLDV